MREFSGQLYALFKKERAPTTHLGGIFVPFIIIQLVLIQQFSPIVMGAWDTGDGFPFVYFRR